MRSLGIDLGTSNTVAAASSTVVRFDGKSQCIMPSVVSFPPTGEVVVGDDARKRRGFDAPNTISSSKRIIGRAFTSYEVSRFKERSAQQVIADANGRAVFRTRAGDLSPRDIAARVLSSLATRAAIDPRRLSAVVGVPTAFDEAQRAATRGAVRDAGFAEARCVEEPVATAIAYLARSSLRYAVVYDLGGGTFDLAVVDCSRYPFRVVGHGGDAYLGGDDVDRALAEHAADRVLRATGWDLRNDPQVWDRLVLEAERAKIRLAAEEVTTVDIASVDPAAPTQISTMAVDRDLLFSVSEDLVKRTFALCDEVLGEASVRREDVDAVFLAGGSTALPRLRDMVGAYFGKRPRHDMDPMTVVAVGASLAAARPDLSGLMAQV